ncbi:MAG: hypothetical protein HKN47_28130, partial [Pirellulaceae bacterium]|nr:hypothetical protein [Pirellulaceae bacterium]
QTSSDQDNDTETIDAEEFYGTDYDGGYASFRDDDNDGFYESYSRYHDLDGDRLHDSYATYRDTNRDGQYDDYKLNQTVAGTPNAVHRSKVAQSTKEGLSGKREQISGKIVDTKYVKRLGQPSYLLHVQSQDGKKMWVDMGSNSTYQLFKDDSVTAHGPIVKMGDKRVLLATMVDIDGKQRAVPRTGRRFSGTVKSTRTAKVSGQEHLVAKLETESGKMLTVDMGDVADNKTVKKGDNVEITGVPVKVGDRVVLIADKNSL